MTHYIYLDESGKFDDQEPVALIAGICYSCDDDEGQQKHLVNIGQVLRVHYDKIRAMYSEHHIGIPAGVELLHSGNYEESRSYVWENFPDVIKQLEHPERYAVVVMAHALDSFLPEEGLWAARYRNMLITLLDELVKRYPEDKVVIHVPTREVTIAFRKDEVYDAYHDFDPAAVMEHKLSDGRYRYAFAINTMASLLDSQGRISAANGSKLLIRKVAYGNWPTFERNFCQYGYYLADWCCTWLRSLFVKKPHMAAIQKRLLDMLDSGVQDAGLECALYGYGSEMLALNKMRDSLAEGNYGAYLDAILRQSQHGTEPEKLLALNPLKDATLEMRNEFITAADAHIKYRYYYPARYQEAMILCEYVTRLAEEAGLGVEPLMAPIWMHKMCCYQHVGRTREAREMFVACYKALRGDSYRLLELENKYAQTFIDMFEYETAEKRLLKAMKKYGSSEDSDDLPPELIGTNEEGFPMNPNMATLMGRCNSSMGQIMSYQWRWDEAEEYFYTALMIFDELGQTSNYGITSSHYLHMLISKGAAGDGFRTGDHFYQQAESSFCQTGSPLEEFSTWEQWYRAIASKVTPVSDDARFSYWHYLTALYVYLTHCVEKEAANTEWRENIRRMLFTPDTRILYACFKENEDPIELISKYLLLLAVRCGAGQTEINYYKKKVQRNIETTTATLKIISHGAMLEYLIATNARPRDREEARQALLQTLEQTMSNWPSEAQEECSALHNYLDDVRNAPDICAIRKLTYENV